MYENMSKFANRCFFFSFLAIVLTGIAMSFFTEAALFTLSIAFFSSFIGCATVVMKSIGIVEDADANKGR